MIKRRYYNIHVRSLILCLAATTAGVIGYAATTKTAQVEPGSRETVTYDQVDPGGEYQLKIE